MVRCLINNRKKKGKFKFLKTLQSRSSPIPSIAIKMSNVQKYRIFSNKRRASNKRRTVIKANFTSS